MYIINIEMKVRFDPGKALVVKQKHDVDMELVREEILAGRFDGDEVKKWRRPRACLTRRSSIPLSTVK